MSTTYLKIKIKSLAAEARIIRFEERRSAGDVRAGLHQHRVLDVRREQRAALLAYGYLRKRSYRRIESASSARPATQRIVDLVRKYGPLAERQQVADEIAAWLKA